jgi:hypothetical protein
VILNLKDSWIRAKSGKACGTIVGMPIADLTVIKGVSLKERAFQELNYPRSQIIHAHYSTLWKSYNALALAYFRFRSIAHSGDGRR